MSFVNIPAGKVPDEMNVLIEIPANSTPIKYEIDKETDALWVDRFMATTMFYPANYGFVNQTLGLDGDPVDVLVVTPYPLHPGCAIRCRPVAVLKMTDDGGQDAKIIAVPVDKLTTIYKNVRDLDDLPELLRAQIQHFFERYKDLEPGKWARIDGWEGVESAKKELMDGVTRYQAQK
ncbi:MAG: inorganic diphosphatase [Thiotrichales bacterium]|jgi:inorganic pyrophosphatase|nr:inorganic diphosphatase [Thiotrichales bacterium]